MIKIIFSLSLILCSIQIFAYEIGPEALNGSGRPQLSHSGEGPFDTYLTMDLPFGPYENLRQQVEKSTGPLNHRGEAHITVITPVEFFQILRPAGITIEEIHGIARKLKIQDTRFKLLCVGQGKLNEIETYYAVVLSPDLLKIRQEIGRLLSKKTGENHSFDPQHFYPHVTLGFKGRDLHESDGVIKNEKSCLRNSEISVSR